MLRVSYSSVNNYGMFVLIAQEKDSFVSNNPDLHFNKATVSDFLYLLYAIGFTIRTSITLYFSQTHFVH